MKPRLLVGLAVGAVVAVIVWLALGRHRERPRPAAAAGSAAIAPRPEARARPDRGEDRGGGGEPTILVDDDPAGVLRLEGLVLDADEKPVGGATVVVSANPSRVATTDADGSFGFDKLVGRSYT